MYLINGLCVYDAGSMPTGRARATTLPRDKGNGNGRDPFRYASRVLDMVRVRSRLVVMPNKEHNRLYDTVRWRKARARHLDNHPLCVMCLQQGRDTMATVIDHIIEHKGDYDMFWDEDNWQSLCAPCHSGNKRQQEHHGYSQACGDDGVPIDVNHPYNKGKKESKCKRVVVEISSIEDGGKRSYVVLEGNEDYLP